MKHHHVNNVLQMFQKEKAVLDELGRVERDAGPETLGERDDLGDRPVLAGDVRRPGDGKQRSRFRAQLGDDPGDGLPLRRAVAAPPRDGRRRPPRRRRPRRGPS